MTRVPVEAQVRIPNVTPLLPTNVPGVPVIYTRAYGGNSNFRGIYRKPTGPLGTLGHGPRIQPAKIKRRTVVYAQQNKEAAHIILSNPEKYSGLAAEWARLFLTRENEAARASYASLPLFEVTP
jgi:hypothetical protein